MAQHCPGLFLMPPHPDKLAAQLSIGSVEVLLVPKERNNTASQRL